jgi:hypothetical protein
MNNLLYCLYSYVMINKKNTFHHNELHLYIMLNQRIYIIIHYIHFGFGK